MCQRLNIQNEEQKTTIGYTRMSNTYYYKQIEAKDMFTRNF